MIGRGPITELEERACGAFFRERWWGGAGGACFRDGAGGACARGARG